MPRPETEQQNETGVVTKKISDAKQQMLAKSPPDEKEEEEEDPLDVLDHLLVYLDAEERLTIRPKKKPKKALPPSQYSPGMGMNDLLSFIGSPMPLLTNGSMMTGETFMDGQPLDGGLINLPSNDPFGDLILGPLPLSSQPPLFPSLSSIPPPPPPIFDFDMPPPPPPPPFNPSTFSPPPPPLPPLTSGPLPPLVTTPHYDTVFSSMAQQLQDDLGVAPMELTERLHTALDAYCISHPGKSMSWKVWASEKTIWCHYCEISVILLPCLT